MLLLISAYFFCTFLISAFLMFSKFLAALLFSIPAETAIPIPITVAIEKIIIFVFILNLLNTCKPPSLIL
jgi:hypothetical protein